ncbi:hypothetical protein [Streptomyces sp. B6B3]|uniref:hypothetical protein n=1 Tax=Streptomyces sp. B6B3 TaxID=3153570 RepID=UPI00325F6441
MHAAPAPGSRCPGRPLSRPRRRRGRLPRWTAAGYTPYPLADSYDDDPQSGHRAVADRFREWGEPVRGRRAVPRVRMGRTLAAYRRSVNLRSRPEPLPATTACGHSAGPGRQGFAQ